MITISHLTANLPFHECSIRFMLKTNTLGNKASEASLIPLKQQFIQMDLNQKIEVGEGIGSSQELILCVLALTDENKVYIGHVDIRMDEPAIDKKEYLKGIEDQNGFLIYSITGQQNNEGVFKKINLKEKKIFATQTPRQFIEESIQEEQKQKKEEEREVQNFASLVEQIKLLILEESLKNSHYQNRLNQNQIFQLTNRQRLQNLIGPFK